MRLAAVEKMGFFATPPRVVDLIADTVTPAAGGRLLDCCAGEGRAAAVLAHRWGLSSWGVELDPNRAAKAAQVLGRCLNGSYHQLQAPVGGFSVLYLNPPYDAGVSEDGYAVRQEVQFLAGSHRFLAGGGLLVYVVPQHILKNEQAKSLLGAYFMEHEVFLFPNPEHAAYKQVVLFARKRHPNRDSSGHYYSSFYLSPKRTVLGEGGYTSYSNLAQLIALRPPDFYLRGQAPESMPPMNGGGVYATPRWRVMMEGEKDLTLRPLLAMRPGHRAMLLAAGALDGAELAPNILVKGASLKTVTEKIDEEAEKVYRTERIISKLSTLDLVSGEFMSLRTDEKPEAVETWFAQHGPRLAELVKEALPPAFDGDWAKAGFTFDGIKAPGLLPGMTVPDLLPVQKTAAAAVAMRWREHKSAVLCGEMGVGKTSCAIAASVLAKHKKVIVMCPGHLVKKWMREVQTMTGVKAVTAKKLGEVDAFFAGPARFLVLSKETAKLGARWEPRFIRKLRLPARLPLLPPREARSFYESQEDLDESNREIQAQNAARLALPRPPWPELQCPRCAQQIKSEYGSVAGEEGMAESKMKCLAKIGKRRCGEPLWQALPISDKGTKRWPLARYINRRYPGRYTLICDEVHQMAKSDSAQAVAMQHLASGARKLLSMTGTLYGGRASMIFYLLYKVDHQFRELYKWDGCREFSENYGLFESIIELDKLTSRFGTKKNTAGGRIKEIPGAHPGMIKLLLGYTIFIRLADLGYTLPPYTESVEVIDHDPAVLEATRALQADVKNVLREQPRALGAYLQACLGYPDCPEHEEQIEGYDLNGQKNGEIIGSALAIVGALWPKDERLVEIVREERAAGRRVLVFFSQTNARNPQPRVQAALEAAGFKVAVLRGDAPPEDREAWCTKTLEAGFDVLLTNGRLVETGLDLLWAQTIVQYGTEYSVPTLRQSTRRSWRLGQTLPVKVIYLCYAETMQAMAMTLIAKKMRAAELIDGEENGGLARFDDSGNDFFLELARAACAE